MFLTIVFLPLISAFICGILGFLLGGIGSSFISCFCLFITCFFCWVSFFKVGFYGCNVYITVLPWIQSGLFNFNWGFMFDSLTSVILVVVTTVSFLVHLYSVSYIGDDPHRSRFISYLSLFTFFIIILVTADNLVQIFVGWEGVGLCSYLLINFWYTRIQANKAAIKAMLVNRIGDFALSLGILLLFIEVGSVEYQSIFSSLPFIKNNSLYLLCYSFSSIDIISLLLFVGAIGKSAQLGLHTWLPDAIEGPTPVSALIHAATIVTAGVFLLARCSLLFEYSLVVLNIITVVGAITAFIAASIGLFQNDLKKVIAYSTCSQLGYIVFSCGLSSYGVGVFHLSNHAFFKALLFLSAGAVIHGISDEQDIRKIGGLVNLIPLTYSVIIIGSLALIGFPFLSGFYSKDLILEVAYGSFKISGHFAYYFGSIAACFTAFYSIRLVYLTFLNKPIGYQKIIKSAHEGDFFLIFPLFVLSFFSMFVGFFSKDFFIGVGTDFFENSLFIFPSNYFIFDAEFMPVNMKLFPLLISFIGMFSSVCVYGFCIPFFYKIKKSNFGRIIYTFYNKKWFFDKIYNEVLSQSFLKNCYFTTYHLVDRGIIEILGPFGLTKSIYKKSYALSKLHTGNLFHYNFMIITIFIFFIILFSIVFFQISIINLSLVLVIIIFISLGT